VITKRPDAAAIAPHAAYPIIRRSVQSTIGVDRLEFHPLSRSGDHPVQREPYGSPCVPIEVCDLEASATKLAVALQAHKKQAD
jgi:hypothetical protein